jgi:hypothetical protein
MLNMVALALTIHHAVATAYRFSDHPTLGANGVAPDAMFVVALIATAGSLDEAVT